MHDLRVDGTGVSCEVDTDRARRRCCARLAAAGVRSLVSQPPTLEELFLRHYGDELPGRTGR